MTTLLVRRPCDGAVCHSGVMASVVMCTCGWWKWLPLHSLATVHGALHLVDAHWNNSTAMVNIMKSYEHS